MFVSLLIALLSIALLITSVVVLAFRKPIQGIFNRLIGEALSEAWVRFLTFALYVVGIASAVHGYRLDKYVSKQHKDAILTELNLNTKTIEDLRRLNSVLL